ncbi:Cuticlin-1 [Aphelenchoides besseyi]|nr:Cuticlin-1 [Aphelenchoides besseyi]
MEVRSCNENNLVTCIDYRELVDGHSGIEINGADMRKLVRALTKNTKEECLNFWRQDLRAVFEATTSFAVSVEENGILGDPYVNCGGDFIEVRFDTRNTFRGVIFVKDQLEWPECRSAPIDSTAFAARNASIRLNFKDCSLERHRSTSPRGIFISTQLVLAFSPEVLTKYDKVFTVQCFYMEMQKLLEKEITVNMPTPPLQTQQVPMPTCRYEVLNGSPEGPPVFYATIGQMVYHKWTCDTETKNQFCMIVHMDDGNGDRVELIDNQGCAKDKFLLSNLDYVSDLMVGKEAHVYKYADRQSMFFDCQISLTIKEPGQEFCDVPNCPDPPRRRRSENSMSGELETTFTTTVEPENNKSWYENNYEPMENSICMTGIGITAFLIGNISVLGGSFVLLYGAFNKIAHAS